MAKYETNPYAEKDNSVYSSRGDYWSSVKDFSRSQVAGASSVYLPKKARYERKPFIYSRKDYC